LQHAVHRTHAGLARGRIRGDIVAFTRGSFPGRAALRSTPSTTRTMGTTGGADSPSDASLIAAIASHGDRTAFAELFARYAPKLISHFARTAGDRARAEDLAQDVMLSVWANAASYRPELAAASTWIFRIARNRHIDLARRKRHFEIEPDFAEFSDAAAPVDDQVAGQHFGERVLAELAQLPEEQAEVLRGSYFQHETAVELAERLSVPVGTVKSRLRAAVGQLRARLFQGGGT